MAYFDLLIDSSSFRLNVPVFQLVHLFILQVTLGVLLVNAPMIVWSIWAALGILWVITFVLHEIVYICYKLVHKIRKKEAY